MFLLLFDFGYTIGLAYQSLRERTFLQFVGGLGQGALKNLS